jgi:hypothetical protein
LAHAKRRRFERCPVLGLALLVLLLAGVAEAGEPDGEQADSADSAASTESKDDAPEVELSDEEKKVLKLRLERSQEADPTNVETPVFPEIRYRDAIRIRFSNLFLPRGDFGTYQANLYHPTVRARFTFPLRRYRSVVQVTARGALSHYDFSGAVPLALQGVNTMHHTSLVIQGAHQINDVETSWLFREGEAWSILANAFARSRYETGAFSDGLTYGGALALGYQSDKVRLAAGVALESELTGGGVGVGFVGNLRWDPTRKLTIRNRGLGVQFEYRVNPVFSVIGSAYQSEQKYRLDVPGEVELRDEQILVGAGFEWKISKYFRLLMEGGAVPSRNLRVRLRGSPALVDQDADTGGYLDIRLEIRP